MQPIKLHHFGEDLICALISNLSFKQFYKFLEVHAFCPLNDADQAEFAKRQRLKYVSHLKFLKAKTMVRLKFKNSDWTCDSEHTIDVTLMTKREKMFSH